MIAFVVIVGETTVEDPLEATAPVKLDQLRGDFEKLALPCDAAQLAVGEGLQSLMDGDRIALARDAKAMERACGAAWLAVDDLVVPVGLSDDQERRVEAMIETCEMAFFVRKGMAEKLMPVIDGDMRPSTLAALQDELGAVQQRNGECVVALQGIETPPTQQDTSAE